MHRRLILLTLLAFVTAIAVGSLAAAAPLATVTMFSTGLNPGSVPFRIVSGADGNVWFSDQGVPTKAMGRITTSGTITEFGVPAGSVPRQVRVGADGNIWFTDTATPAIGRITPSGTVTLFSLPAGTFPNALAMDLDGNIWFTDRDTTPAIWRITPSGAMTPLSIGLNAGSLPNGIAPAADGNMWFTDQGPTRAIGRITTTGTITEFTAGLNPGTNPAALTPGPDGNVWFTDQGTIKAIGQVTPAGTITEANSGLNPGSVPGEITPGADGNLWFTDRGTITKAIGSVTPSATGWTITNYSLAATSLPGGIRTGPDGNLWFTDNGTPQAIGQFGVGAPAASITAPAVTGSGKEGTPHVCAGDTWSNWSGQQPSRTAYGFDGYRWLRDGTVIAGQTAAAYTPTADDVGHQLSCTVTVTYMLFPTTVSAASAAVLVHEATPPVLSLPNAIVVNATGPNGVVVTYTVTATDNADPNPVVSCTPPSGSTFAIGTTTVNCTATDAAGNSSSGSFTVTVKGAGEQLADLAAAVKGVGRGKSLAATVALAQWFFAHGRIHATCVTLAVFIHEVREQSGKKIPMALATALIADAIRIRAVLNCSTPTNDHSGDEEGEHGGHEGEDDSD